MENKTANVAFLNDVDVLTLRNTCKEGKHSLTDKEFDQYLAVIERRKLDPFTRQIYYTKRNVKEGDAWVSKMQIEATIDGLRVVAERSGAYAGQDGPFWCGDDGVWKDVWLDKEPPKASKVGVYKNGFKAPLYAVANWEGYVQCDRAGKVTAMWLQLGPHMLAKVAEALALRKAFPQDMSGLYTREEMSRADVPDSQELKVGIGTESQVKNPEPKQETQATPAAEKIEPKSERVTPPVINLMRADQSAEISKIVLSRKMSKTDVSSMVQRIAGKPRSLLTVEDADNIISYLRTPV